MLILVAVTVRTVIQSGLFGHAGKATSSYSMHEAREQLGTTLASAMAEKYTNRNYNENDFLDEYIKNSLPESEIVDDIAIIGGWEFEIDRSVPKIVDCLGRADGVIITAKVTGSNGWQKPNNAKITITGTIKTYSGGTITNATATNNGTPIANFPTSGGNYTIDNISSDTEIIINATDSKGKTNSKTIPITIKVDNIPPIVDTLTAKTEKMKIIFSATGHDNESGLKQFNYTITSTQDTTLAGIPENQRNATFKQEEIVTITSTKEATYTITVTAEDNVGNQSAGQIQSVTTIDGLTVAEAKEKIKAEGLKQYIGTKIIDYNPQAKGIWRIFYYDSDGKFGTEGALYLRRDYDHSLTFTPKNYINYMASPEGIENMKNVNPMWANSNYNEIDNGNEKAVSYLCDPVNWENYYDNNFNGYAIGAASLELFTESYNTYGGSFSPLLPTIISSNGYSLGYKNSFNWGGDGGFKTPEGSIEAGPNNIYVCWKTYCWLSSPGSYTEFRLWAETNDYLDSYYRDENSSLRLRPLACVL